MELAIEVKSLQKSFSRKKILNNINLHVPKGSIYAFLGQNGQGKSTTIKLLTGVLEADAGSIKLFDHLVSLSSTSYRKHIGCLIDSPSNYPNLIANEFLHIACILKSAAKSEVERVLELVNLENSAVRIKDYSLGMKQRLSIAFALIGNPKLLILDEPTSALDPLGIQNIRSLFQRLTKQGCTIFLSSHNLEEVEKVCSHFCVLHDGSIQFESSIKDWQKSHETSFAVEVCRPHLAQQVLAENNITAKVSDSNIKLHSNSLEQRAAIHKVLFDNDIQIFRSFDIKPNLEQWFIETQY
ncbi:ABC transporter [Shewanella sp. OPT22]|nr:ABC transporter [Shewanella sp. OPT22]